ncbi:SDR family oxidoreductase [Aurantiacibacter aquimixticola]|uniref:SDR family oxidoreductase n=1 Tax=Aurantiacibacter aquimixticola TaxID=1958945 RepID=A0A419RSD3_9SPHN|nr:SDR family oxidoreductase [Aurantiacibacter aquimixticola]RJY08685.1 SDR family oxidoreductase [Aurantiacibacter aquimixticola]
MARYLLFGPTGGVGQHILRQALDAGVDMRAAERSWDEDPAPDMQYERREADVLESDLDPLMDGCDAVISAIGVPRDPATLINPPPIYTEGAVRMVQAMRRSNVKRLVVISAAFADHDTDIPMWFQAAVTPLRRIFRQMAEMERVLRVADDISWTAVRPGWLLDRELTRDYNVEEGGLPEGTLRTRRADLAHFMLDCVENDAWVRECPFIARREKDELEGPGALIEEFRPS